MVIIKIKIQENGDVFEVVGNHEQNNPTNNELMLANTLSIIVDNAIIALKNDKSNISYN